ncbi:MAG: hypothetical protein ACRC2T_09320, partial [Thermoguttaceae bacterium]
MSYTKSFRYVLLALCTVFVSITIFGCSRTQYRHKADVEAYSLIKTVADDPRWELTDFTISTDKESRFYDPYNPDCEPMPQDDPTAHKFMQCVDGMKGSKAWQKYGKTSYTENPYWKQYLVVDAEDEIVLDKETAVRLAIKNSPAYQSALENLYLSALAVSAQRFEFDTKFFGGDSLFYNASGKTKSEINNGSNIDFSKKFATGADFAAGLANTMTWNLSGGESFTTQSVLNFNFVQPLLRGGGRAIALENLTQAERNFLANVRQMVYFQQGFYVSTVSGSGGVAGPGGASSGGSGYYSLLSEQVRINNQLQNIAQLEDTVNRTTELFLANVKGIRKIDIDNSVIQLLSSQGDLLSQKGRYDASIEQYLISLGLPPDLKVKVRDPLLEQFELMSPSLRRLQDDVAVLLTILRDEKQEIPDDIRARLPDFTSRLRKEVGIVEKDLIGLEKASQKRIENLQSLAKNASINNGEVSQSVCNIADF